MGIINRRRYMGSVTPIDFSRWITAYVYRANNGSTKLLDNTTGIDAVNIDGKNKPVQNNYTLEAGEHIVRYKFTNDTNVENNNFRNCTAITKMIVPDNFTRLSGSQAFYITSNMTEIELPDTITSMGSYTFGGSGITSFHVPQSLTAVGYYSFTCPNLTAVYIKDLSAYCKISFASNNSCPLYNGHYLYLNDVLITDLVVPNDITKMDGFQFYGFYGNSITIPSGLTNIGDRTFSRSNVTSIIVDVNNTVYDSRNNCNAIIKKSDNSLVKGCSTTVIPNTVTKLNNHCFMDTPNLTTMDIPSSVTSIGNEAFRYCSSATAITIRATTPPTLGNNVFNDTNSCPIYVPSASVETYKETTKWSDYASRIQAIPT